MKNELLSGRFFIDTNVIIYSFDQSALNKRALARQYIAQGLSSNQGIISHQVIQEFVSVAQNRFAQAFDKNTLTLYLDEVLFCLWKASPSRELYLQALQVKAHFKFSWWDSLIVAAALDTKCEYLLSEDFQHRQKISTLTVINPFHGLK